jgi:secondary thiamine-phosphate synthase enzyme
VRDSRFRCGLAVVSTLHTTAALVVNEHEPELLKDLDGFLARLAPESGIYGHNGVPHGVGEQPNGHAHCQALLLNASISLPIVGGRLMLGRYQRVFLVELDFSRPRSIAVTLLGA